MTKRDFSYNTPEGACPACNGLGVTNEPNPKMLINYDKSIRNGGIFGWDEAYIYRYGEALVNAGRHYGFEFSIDSLIRDYNHVQMTLLLYGVVTNLKSYIPTLIRQRLYQAENLKAWSLT